MVVEIETKRTPTKLCCFGNSHGDNDMVAVNEAKKSDFDSEVK